MNTTPNIPRFSAPLTDAQLFKLLGPQRPQKAPTEPVLLEDFAYLSYPLYCTPKLDGIRATIQGGRVLSNTLKPIPNKYVQAVLGGRPELEGLDGELIVGSPTAKNCRQTTVSGVMSMEGTPDFTFRVFDTMHSGVRHLPFEKRLEVVLRLAPTCRFISAMLPMKVIDPANLTAICEAFLAEGYEGAMLRPCSAGGYKHGRATAKDNLIFKVKPMEDAEAVVVGFIEGVTNTNESVRRENGLLKKSTAVEGLVPAGTLGALRVANEEFGYFNIGSGFTEAQRAEIWDNQSKFLGKVVTFKFQRHGMKDKPNPAIFVEFRHALDITDY